MVAWKMAAAATVFTTGDVVAEPIVDERLPAGSFAARWRVKSGLCDGTGDDRAEAAKRARARRFVPSLAREAAAEVNAFVVEVLRADGSACAPGETGRVVVTNLHNFAMPMIRYELGDQAAFGADGNRIARLILEALPFVGVRGHTTFADLSPVQHLPVGGQRHDGNLRYVLRQRSARTRALPMR